MVISKKGYKTEIRQVDCHSYQTGCCSYLFHEDLTEWLIEICT